MVTTAFKIEILCARHRIQCVLHLVLSGDISNRKESAARFQGNARPSSADLSSSSDVRVITDRRGDLESCSIWHLRQAKIKKQMTAVTQLSAKSTGKRKQLFLRGPWKNEISSDAFMTLTVQRKLNGDCRIFVL